MTRYDWHVTAIFDHSQWTKGDLSHARLAGVVRESERTAVVYPAEVAPPGASHLDGHLVRNHDEWWLDMLGAGQIGPVRFADEKDHLAHLPFDRAHCSTLSSSRVLLLGAGSVGSAMAACLARAGVGCIAVADPDRIEMTNLCRHTASTLDLGRPKANVLVDQVRQFPADIQTEAFAEDIYDWESDRRRDFLHGFDLAIATTDRRSVQLRTAHETMQLGVPCLLAGCFEEARGGEVFVNLPGTTAPCYVCLRGTDSAQPPRGPIDYSSATNADEFAAEPGMAAAVWLVACVAAQVAVAVLLRSHDDSELGQLIRPDRNYLLIGTAQAKGYFRFAEPFETFFQPLSGKRSDCESCGHEERA